VGAARCFKCTAAARYEHASEGTFACSKHTPKKKAVVTKSALTKKPIEELRADIVGCGLKTDATKKGDLVKLLYNHARQNTWKKCVASSTAGSVMDLSPAIVSCLDKRMDSWKGADAVCIENQPERRMYAVQAMLQMYFTMKGIKSAGVSATHKLSNLVTVDDTVASYKGRKKTGIAHALVLVPAYNQAHFTKHPKKDDLADSFLQGLWVLEHSRA
jgi:hypothetical protein